MSRVRVESFSVTLDGFGAGAGQGLEHPLGLGGPSLHGRAFTTRTFRQMFGHSCVPRPAVPAQPRRLTIA